MEPCGECLILEHQLRRANERLVSLALRQDKMVGGGNAAATTCAIVEDALEHAQVMSTAFKHLLEEHRTIHKRFNLTPEGEKSRSGLGVASSNPA